MWFLWCFLFGWEKMNTEQRINILEKFETEPDLLSRVVTGDEQWIFQYDPLTKHQSLEWKSTSSPPTKKARMSKFKDKVMLIAFFDIRKIVDMEFMPQGQTIQQSAYNEILRRFMRSIEERENCWRLSHGCSVATMPLLTMPWVSGNFWQKITLPYWSNHHIHRI